LYRRPLEPRRGGAIIRRRTTAHCRKPAMKGMDQKKQDKKKPEKSLKEKRAAKKEKKAGK
jgi:hypothetical protein